MPTCREIFFVEKITKIYSNEMAKPKFCPSLRKGNLFELLDAKNTIFMVKMSFFCKNVAKYKSGTLCREFFLGNIR